MNLLLRADAHVAIGTGHVMRCLALAQAWQDAGGRASFIMAQSTPAVQKRLRSRNCEILTLDAEGGSIRDAHETAKLARAERADWVVVDGYHFGAEYQLAIKERGLSLLFIDDNGNAASYHADLILNQNIHAEEGLYRLRSPQTRLLLGSRYAMLRREFAAWREWQREFPERARALLVTLGGSDPENLTLRILEGIPSEQGWHTTVVVGGSNPHLPQLQRWVEDRKSDFQLEVDVIDMGTLMAKSDLAIAAAGTTSWEMCALGLPALLVVAADNQCAVAEELARRGAAENLGWGTKLSAKLVRDRLDALQKSRTIRQAMSMAGRLLVDGLGAERVVLALRTASLRLRSATLSDCRQLWEWANDRRVRDSAFCSNPIAWEEHCAWFEARLRDARSRVYIAIDSWDLPVGQIRFDENGSGEAEIDVSVAPQCRGMGLAKRLIEIGAQRVFEDKAFTQLHAYVKPANAPSLRAFQSAGFREVGTKLIQGQEAVHYTLNKS